MNDDYYYPALIDILERLASSLEVVAVELTLIRQALRGSSETENLKSHLEEKRIRDFLLRRKKDIFEKLRVLMAEMAENEKQNGFF